ncbi:MAG: response regulator [Planctomycetota bacterium]|nr:response regulator [Planctomycetota bacterium]
MTVIKGYAEMLLRRSLVMEEGRGMLREILRAVDRSTTTTGQLLAYGRRETLRPSVQSLSDCLAEIGKILPHMIGEDIRLAVVSGAGDCRVNVDAHLFQQAILNLVTNARDAMPEGGTLSIKTDGLTLGAESRRIDPDLPEGPYALVTVTDTGSGMDKPTLARAFDPFFTTKDVGKGTGLGLPMVYGFVKQSGGAIDIQSEPGRGTTVQLYFPCAAEATAPAPGQAGARASRGGNETVLLVEDETSVRSMTAQLLRAAGYRVLQAPDAETALAIAQQADRPIDVLLSDVVMPGMTGVALAEQLRARDSNLAVVFMSGYPGVELSTRGLDQSKDILTKPFTSELLLERIRRVLDSPKPATGR